jgi:flavin-binding protein dodecin
MISTTSLKNPTTQWNIEAAIIRAVQMSNKTDVKVGWADVKNKRGEVSILVRHCRDKLLTSMQFFDHNMNEITGVVLKSIRENVKGVV